MLNLDKSSVLVRKGEAGFTLVELLVVIAIIAILTAIAVPTFLSQRKSAADSVLSSDLRAAGQSYATWRTDPENTNDTFRIAANNNYYMLVAGENSSYNPGSSTVRWNEVPGLPPMNVSEGSYMTLAVVANAATNGWHTAHSEGELCIAGSNAKSHYDYTQGSGNFAEYSKHLYYDSALGGVQTIDEMVEAYNAGNHSSCYLYVERYKDALGV